MPRPPLASGWPERIARALIGFLAGCTTGLFVGALLAGLGASLGLLSHPDPWAKAIAMATSLGAAIWLPLRGPRLVALQPRPPRRRRPTTGHGWVDLVFRMGLGIASGTFVSLLAFFTLVVWLPRPTVWYGPFEYTGIAVFLLTLSLGPIGGFVWYAFDFPWFAPRRPTPMPMQTPRT